MTGINPKMVSTGVWAIAGFLGTVAILLTATDQTSADLVHIGPDTLLRGMAAALIGGMVSFPRAALGAVAIGILDRVLFFNYTTRDRTRAVRALPRGAWCWSRASAATTSGSAEESFQFAPRIAAVPRAAAQHLVGEADAAAPRRADVAGGGDPPVALRQVGASPDVGHHHRVRALRDLGGRAHRLGRPAVARSDGLRRPGCAHRGRTDPWSLVRHRVARNPVPRRRTAGHLVPVGVARRRGRSPASSRSSSASARCASAGCCSRSARSRSRSPRRRTSSAGPIFTAGSTTIEIPRADIGPLELTHRNRAYYYFVLFVLVVVLLLVGHLKRTGIGRMIVGVRENELAAAAMTVSPARAKLIAFAMGGFIAGLGGVLLGAVNLTFAPAEQHYFLVDDSLRLVAIVVIGGLGSLSGAVVGAVWVDRPARRSGPATRWCRCSPRASACSSSCCTSPAASSRSATTCATRSCGGSTNAWGRSTPRRRSPRHLRRCGVTLRSSPRS